MSERLKVEEGPRAKQHRCLQKLEKAGRDESLRSLRKEPALPTHFQTSDLQTVKEYIICVALSSSTSGNVSQQPLETVARRGSLGQEGLAGEQSSTGLAEADLRGRVRGTWDRIPRPPPPLPACPAGPGAARRRPEDLFTEVWADPGESRYLPGSQDQRCHHPGVKEAGRSVRLGQWLKLVLRIGQGGAGRGSPILREARLEPTAQSIQTSPPRAENRAGEGIRPWRAGQCRSFPERGMSGPFPRESAALRPQQ